MALQREARSLPGCSHKTSLNTLLQRCIAAERGNRVFLNSPIQIHAHQTTLLVRDALLSKGPNSGLSVLLNL
jgi:hypothetical protein